ncbi:Metallo-peptidase family M12-domain-containing protein [Lentinula raphanica]|nr:Metallo-peptidase family M12-domain-containing protein [Lentinula raphanica]
MLIAVKFYALAVVSLLSLVDLTSASSKRAGRLKRLAHPYTLSLEILPRHQHISSSTTLSSYDKRQLLTPRSNTLRYSDSFRLIISAFDDTFHLHLRPNDHLIHPAARITYHTMDSDGRSSVSRSEPLLRENVKAYWGEVIHGDDSDARLREDAAGVIPRPSRSPSELGWARIMVHHQGNIEDGIAPIYEGAFSYKGVVYHIMTRDNYLRNKHHLDPQVLVDTVDSHLVVWRDSDLMPHHSDSPAMCGHDNLPYNTDPALNPILQRPFAEQSISLGLFGNISLSRRDDVAGSGASYNFEGTIGNSAGCPTTQKLLYMGVAADCKYVSNYGGSMNATTQILTNWNSASALYKSTFNVSLGIVEVQVQNETCPTTADSDIPWNVDCTNVDLNDRLSLFSEWRGQRGNDSIGLWHLMSGCPQELKILSMLMLVCILGVKRILRVLQGLSPLAPGVHQWPNGVAVVSHEIGHNFGAFTIVLMDFIMNPVSESTEKRSVLQSGNICSLMSGTSSGGKTDASCLVMHPHTRSLLSLQMCGNGIVEEGEDCDPEMAYLPHVVIRQLVNSQAVLDVILLPARAVPLRPSKNATCDPAEFCTGSSSACPQMLSNPTANRCQTVVLAWGSHRLLQSSRYMSDNCQDPNNTNPVYSLRRSWLTDHLADMAVLAHLGSVDLELTHSVLGMVFSQLAIAIPVTVVGGIVILLLSTYQSLTVLSSSQVPKRASSDWCQCSLGSVNASPRLTSKDSASTRPRVPSVRRPPPVDRENGWRPVNRASTTARSSGTRSTWVDPTQYNGPRS